MKRILTLLILALIIASHAACGSDTPTATPLPSSYNMAVPTPIVPVAAPPTPIATAAPMPEQNETPPVVPSWETALEEFLLEFLPIFTPGSTVRNVWNKWDEGGWLRFAHEQASGSGTSSHRLRAFGKRFNRAYSYT